MALDGIFLYNLKNEIADFACDARVEKIHQPTSDELVLLLRSPEGMRQLLISCRADSARMQFTQFHFENPDKATMLCMLFRKKLCGAKITDITQDGLERIIKIHFQSYNTIGESEDLCLICEFMGRYSNIILLDGNNVIIDAVHRVGSEKSQVRTILPGETYIAPPPQPDKINILTVDLDEVQNRISTSDESPAKAFQKYVLGVSPIVAREYENGVSIETIKYYAEHPIKTAVITDKPIDFTFLPVTQYGSAATTKEFETFSELLDYFYFEKLQLQRLHQRSGELLKHLHTLQEHTVRKKIKRENELKDCEGKERYKLYGDLLSTNMYRLEKGKEFYDLENYYDDMKIVRVPVSPALTVSQNIQKYYKEYKKKQVAEKKLNGLIAEANEELEYLRNTEALVEAAESPDDVNIIKAELAEAGYLRVSKKNKIKPKKAVPNEYESSDGFKIYVGKSNIMNEKLSLKIAKADDMWLHAKDCPGSHVIIVCNGKEISENAIYTAAMLAAYNSKAGKSSNVAVDYTMAHNVKKMPNAKPGLVTYTNYKTIFVTPDREKIEEIKRIV